MHRTSPSLPLTAALGLLSSLAACSGGGAGGSTPPPGDPPVISSFSPTSGGAGMEVTISGLLFAETAQGNTVLFNGATATVLSASATSLVAVVPAGASTGKIRVTTAGGSATSSADFTVLTGPGSAWTTRLAGPRGMQNGLAWTGTRLAAVGSGAGFQASTDGRVWRMTSSLSSADDVAWDGSLMVAVGSMVQTSSDGLTWTWRDLWSGLRRVAPFPGGWVAVGDNGVIRTSPDGITWTPRDSGVSKNLRDVTWSGAQLVAVGEDGAVTTSPDGVTWTPRPAPTADSFTAVASSPALVVATTFPYSGSESALLTTPDGVTWTSRAPGFSPFNRVIHDVERGRFVGVGFYRAATSADGVDWTTASDVPGIPQALVHAGSEYVATGSDRNGAGAVFTSSDGLSWSLRSADHKLLAVARRPSDGLLVVVGSDVARTSSDGGATWALHLLTPNLWENYPFLDVVWSPTANAFIALVQVAANQYAYRSNDGRTWTEIAYVPCLGGLAVSETGRLLATGSSYTGTCVATSDDDGATWTPRTPPDDGRHREAFWAGGQFVAVAESGAIATSPDGASWTARASGVTASLRGAAASPSALVVVGDGGAIVTSSDGGVTWTPRVSGTSYPLRRVTWTGSEFLAVGSTGRLLRSADGTAWTTLPTPYTSSPNGYDLNDLAAIPDGGGRLVLVGSGGLIATSP
ncbi:MAG TPA: IPT/TIG domain-containing protein [Anaeromyxobacter sp.]|nr:IPT/TIG domain-containing protein [Anaeromyxobacter sp.]